jgi:hypothetical protein
MGYSKQVYSISRSGCGCVRGRMEMMYGTVPELSIGIELPPRETA